SYTPKTVFVFPTSKTNIIDSSLRQIILPHIHTCFFSANTVCTLSVPGVCNIGIKKSASALFSPDQHKAHLVGGPALRRGVTYDLEGLGAEARHNYMLKILYFLIF
ncbi:hypothetical protein BK125_31235, partial [Paenibacillus odorifer]